ncbi:hypothetical protein LTR99_004123 [Exophiala xenobiotica]|nr:hypothetical protein LTR99_004123 [Exophiala xenobiotica]KAK5549240.1 hypothetical protein LTR23_001070 [Chaetothyriales sp. CCFEE 6169]
MGETGSGKSSLINAIAQQNKVVVGHGLQSTTTKLQVVEVVVDGHRIKLIDTPGYDDTNRSDADVLKDTALFLQATYESQITINGILWLHPISHARMTGSAMRNLRLLQDLVGKDSLRNVRLITTFWDNVDRRIGEQRLQELQHDDMFWKPMIEHGSKVHMYANNKDSAYAIVKTVLNNQRSILEIQKELVDQHRTLWQTAAGMTVRDGWSKTKENIERGLSALQTDMRECLEDNNREYVELLRKQQEQMTRKLKSIAEARASLEDYSLEISRWREKIEAISQQQQLDRQQAVWAIYEDAGTSDEFVEEQKSIRQKQQGT